MAELDECEIAHRGVAVIRPGSYIACPKLLLTRMFLALLALTFVTSVHASEMVSIKWKPFQPMAWVPGNDYIDGHTFNFINGTIEEKGKIRRDGELQAELIVPKGIKGPIPFVVILHGCSGMNMTLKRWAHEYGGKLVEAGYGALILDSFKTRGVGPEGVCADFSQLGWARRRADDAYSALDWLIESGKADPKQVYVLGRSNGATTSLIIMNRKIGDVHERLFAGAFAMQPSCLYMKNVEFYAPVHLFLAERDIATSPVLCAEMAASKRPIPVRTKLWKNATHGYQDRESARTVQMAGKPILMQYNAEASEGTIKAIISILTYHKN